MPYIKIITIIVIWWNQTFDPSATGNLVYGLQVLPLRRLVVDAVNCGFRLDDLGSACSSCFTPGTWSLCATYLLPWHLRWRLLWGLHALDSDRFTRHQAVNDIVSRASVFRWSPDHERACGPIATANVLVVWRLSSNRAVSFCYGMSPLSPPSQIRMSAPKLSRQVQLPSWHSVFLLDPDDPGRKLESRGGN